MRVVLCLSLVTCATARQPVADLSQCEQPWEVAAQTLPDGEALFHHEWTEGDTRSALGDGLGPLFNGRSCVECHGQGGVGGAGGDAFNVAMAPGVGVLHKESTVPGWAAKRVAMRETTTLIGGGCLLCVQRITRPTSERATPALFGAGLIDRVTEEDLIVAEALSGRHHPRVTGRIGRDPDGRAGRFGWKGQTADLPTFVEGACANELGLQTHAEDQPMDPRRPGAAPGVDLERADVEALVAFVSDLPAPRFVPTGAALRGKDAFEEIGCTACHVEDLGDARGVFADLLLHDMGGGLADRMVSTYGGVERITQGTASPREWRTPPLWGVADSGPWLHDGRAKTLDEAIRLHGGESTDIRRAYEALPQDDRAEVIAFLEALVAPNSAAPVLARAEDVVDPVTFRP